MYLANPNAKVHKLNLSAVYYKVIVELLFELALRSTTYKVSLVSFFLTVALVEKHYGDQRFRYNKQPCVQKLLLSQVDICGKGICDNPPKNVCWRQVD